MPVKDPYVIYRNGNDDYWASSRSLAENTEGAEILESEGEFDSLSDAVRRADELSFPSLPILG